MALPGVLAAVLAFMTLVMVLAWAVERAVGNSGWIDVFWTFGTGGACAAAALWPSTGADAARQILVAALTAAWSLRLGGHIAWRVARSRTEDARYARFKAQWGAGYQSKILWLILPQGLVTTLIAASVAVAAWRTAPVLGPRDLAAVLLLLAAMGGESLADWQLSQFKARRTGRGLINETGLWAWSRHPNYFFEWLGWLAYPAMALEPSAPLSWLTLLAPVAMFLVLRFVTGVPPLEAAMLETRGDAFRAYQRRVSVFFPSPPKREVVL